MNNPGHEMYDYWLKQPDALKKILVSRKSLTAEFVKLYQEIKPDRIYMVGSGTSHNSETVAAPFMESVLGIEISVITSSQIPTIHGKKPLIILISQGGSSTNTLEAMEKLAAYSQIAITGEAECEIQKRAQRHMLIGCGEEQAGPKTMGYTSSVMCFYVCALEAGLASKSIRESEYEKIIKTLDAAAENMVENLRRTESWLERHVEELKTVKKYAIVGKEFGAGAAVEGALKILETVRVPVIGFEFEEFLHGPILMTDEHLAGIFFITQDAAFKPRMAALAKNHERYSNYCYTVTGDLTIGGEKTLYLVLTGQPYTEVFEFVLIPQLIGAKIPGLLGLADGMDIYRSYAKDWPTKFNNGK